MPLVSIIIITFNDAAHVGQALEGALGQGIDDLEVIVVDDGSTDNTEALLQSRYGDRIRYIRKPNGGMGSARYAGLEVARGKYIQHLDSDDILLPGKIRPQLEFLECHPEYAVVYSRTICFFDDDPSQTFEHGSNARARSGQVFDDILRGGNWINIGHSLFRRSAIDRVGGWDPKATASDDYDIVSRLAYAGEQVYFLDSPPGFLYRQRRAKFDPDNPQTWRSPENLFRGELYILGKLRAMMVRDGRAGVDILDRRAGELRFQLGRWLFRIGKRREALKLMQQGLATNREHLARKLGIMSLAALVPGPPLWRLYWKARQLFGREAA